MEFLIYLLINLGLTFIVVLSKIFRPLRNYFQKINPKFLGSMIVCCQCFGFWSGILTSFLFFSPTSLLIELPYYLNAIPDGLIVSFVSYAIYLLLIPIIKKYD